VFASNCLRDGKASRHNHVIGNVKTSWFQLQVGILTQIMSKIYQATTCWTSVAHQQMPSISELIIEYVPNIRAKIRSVAVQKCISIRYCHKISPNLRVAPTLTSDVNDSKSSCCQGARFCQERSREPHASNAGISRIYGIGLRFAQRVLGTLNRGDAARDPGQVERGEAAKSCF
jgi:hypothetical protein